MEYAIYNHYLYIMIISASRRTDIPAFYSSWFLNRIKERVVLVPNPYNSKMVSRISLDPAVIDCIVFWSKNPASMLNRLEELEEYNYYFQFTLNPYGKEIENNLPPLHSRIETFKRLSDKIGKEKVIWRYDPIFLNEKYTVHFHQEKFAEIAEEIHPYTEKCMLGFIDHYQHIRTKISSFHIGSLQQEDIETIALSFQKNISEYEIKLHTCTEKINLSHVGISAGSCIDQRLIERITGYSLLTCKDKNQRNVCRCTESIDIGMYESCLNGCIYCYANRGDCRSIQSNRNKHDKLSPLLIGQVKEDATVKDRVMKSLRNNQLPLF